MQVVDCFRHRTQPVDCLCYVADNTQKLVEALRRMPHVHFAQVQENEYRSKQWEAQVPNLETFYQSTHNESFGPAKVKQSQHLSYALDSISRLSLGIDGMSLHSSSAL